MSQYNYACVDKSEDTKKKFSSYEGRFIAGHTIGILVMDLWYPKLPGNVANASTYPYSVLYKLVSFDDPLQLLCGNRELLKEIIKKGRELENEGVRAIICACGYFGHFQAELAQALNVPVYSSSLIQIPWIKIGLRPEQKVGLICASKKNMTADLLKKVGVHDPGILVIEGMDDQVEFSNIQYNRLAFDNEKLCFEVVNVATRLVESNPDIGAILMECSDLPPYASTVQKSVGLPVFDFITLINWVQQSVCQKMYYGSI